MAFLRRRHGLILLMLCAGIASSSALAQADGTRDPLRLKYEAHWGDIPLGDVTVTVRDAPDRYVIEGSAIARGPMAFLFDWTGSAETRGRRQGGMRLPVSHANSGSDDDGERLTMVDWLKSGLPKFSAEPPPDLEEVTPVPTASIANTLDPFTVLLKTMDGLAATGRCEGTARIFDGRRRYDLVIEHLGQGQLVSDRPGAYTGPAVRCRLRAKKIGGFRREASKWSADEDDIERIAWIARLENGVWIPVRAEISAPLGNVVMRMITEGAQSEARRAEPVIGREQYQ